MKDLVIDTLLSVRKSINPNNRKQCFELFGYDFLIDEDLRTWLIEINTNPFLGTPNKDMEMLVPAMLDDMCKLVLDPYFSQPTMNAEKDTVERANGFELIYREARDAEAGVN